MNPLTNVKNINKLNDIEAELGLAGGKTSWHAQYKDSAYIFIGGLPFDLTEGDIICVFSQYGEIMNINLVRDKKSGKSKGYCFLAYEDQRSTILAVDNLNGIKILGRVIRVDHVSNYRKPKEDENDDEITQMLRKEGCAPKTPSPPASEDEDSSLIPQKKLNKEHKSKSHDKKKKKKKHKKDHKHSLKQEVDSSDSNSDHSDQDQDLPVPIRVKQEVDRGYETHQQHEVKKGPIGHDERYYRDEMRQRDDEMGRNRRTEDSQVKHRRDDRGRFQDTSIAERGEGRGDRWNEKDSDKRETQKYHGGRIRDRGEIREMDKDRSRNWDSRWQEETDGGRGRQSSDRGSGKQREAKWEMKRENERDRYRDNDETYKEQQRDKHQERDRSNERQERYSYRESERKSYRSDGARRDDSRRK